MKIEPKYIMYYQRMWNSMRYWSVFLLVLMILSIPAFDYLIFLPIFWLLLLYIRVRRINRYYLHSLLVDPIGGYMEIEVFDYDNLSYVKRTLLSECDLKIIEMNIGFYSFCQMEIYEKKEQKLLIYKQPAVGAWNADSLVKIYICFKQAKNEAINMNRLERMLSAEKM